MYTERTERLIAVVAADDLRRSSLTVQVWWPRLPFNMYNTTNVAKLMF